MSSQTPPGGIGGRLQEARQRGGISLRQVADSTKIPVYMLQALERDDISHLPGGLYCRGYVRSFATVVALDPEATVAQFVAQFPLGSVTSGYPAAERVEVNDVAHTKRSNVGSAIFRSDAFTLPRLAAVGVLPALLVVYLGTARSMPRWPGVGSSFASEAAVQPQRSDRLPALSLETRVPAPVTTLVDSAAAPAAGTRDRSIPVAESIPLADVAPDSPSATVEPQAGSRRNEPPAASPLSEKPVAVLVAASSPTWVIATVDGRKIVNRLFQVGEQESFDARRDLVLTAGDAGAIMMTLNGRMARSLGRPGQTVTARISSANFKDYLRR